LLASAISTGRTPSVTTPGVTVMVAASLAEATTTIEDTIIAIAMMIERILVESFMVCFSFLKIEFSPLYFSRAFGQSQQIQKNN
jgi:hypothetical protein